MEERTLEQIRLQRRKLLSSLEDIFGENHADVKFGKFHSKEVAYYLKMDGSNLSRLLKNPDHSKHQPKGIDAYENAIEKVEKLRILKEDIVNRHSSKSVSPPESSWNPIKNIAIIILILLVALNLIYQQITSSNQVSDINHLSEVYHDSGVIIAEDIAQNTYEALENYARRQKTLSTQDKIDLIDNAHHVIKVALGKGRVQIASENKIMTFSRERNIVDIINHILPIEKVFSCTASEMIHNTLPPCANRFDEELWNLNQTLYDVDLVGNEALFKSRIREMIRSIQFALGKKIEEEFNLFKRTGEFSSEKGN